MVQLDETPENSQYQQISREGASFLFMQECCNRNKGNFTSITLAKKADKKYQVYIDIL